MDTKELNALRQDFLEFVDNSHEISMLCFRIEEIYGAYSITSTSRIVDVILGRVMPSEQYWSEEENIFKIPFDELASKPVVLNDKEYDEYSYEVEVEWEETRDEDWLEKDDCYTDYLLDQDVLENALLERTQDLITRLYYFVKTGFYGYK